MDLFLSPQIYSSHLCDCPYASTPVFNIWNQEWSVFQFCYSFSIVLATEASLQSHMNLKISFSISAAKAIEIFIGIMLNLYHFGYYWHVDNKFPIMCMAYLFIYLYLL